MNFARHFLGAVSWTWVLSAGGLMAAFNLIFRRSWRTASALDVGVALIVFAVCLGWVSAGHLSDVAVTLVLSFCSAYLLEAVAGLAWRRLRGEPLRLNAVESDSVG